MIENIVFIPSLNPSPKIPLLVFPTNPKLSQHVLHSVLIKHPAPLSPHRKTYLKPEEIQNKPK